MNKSMRRRPKSDASKSELSPTFLKLRFLIVWHVACRLAPMHTHGVRAIETVRKPPMVLARCSTLMAFGPSANRSECHLLLRPAASSRVMRMASGIDEGARMPCCASASTSVSHRRRDPGDTCIHIPASASCPLSNRCRHLRLRLVRLPPRCRGVFVANALCVLCSASTSAACGDS